MLVLTRKRDQFLVLTAMVDIPKGTEIKVQITDVARGHATIGISAPKSVRVLRGEIPPQAIDSPEAITQETDDPEHPDFGKDYA